MSSLDATAAEVGDEAPAERCTYCEKHNFDVSAVFASRPSHICKSCGADMAKEAAKRMASAAAAALRADVWGCAQPLSPIVGGGKGGEGKSISARAARRPPHAPTVGSVHLPSWLVTRAAAAGFVFDDPRKGDAKVGELELSGQVAALWRRGMPRSQTCWDIMIQCRLVAYDVSGGRDDGGGDGGNGGDGGSGAGCDSGDGTGSSVGGGRGACARDTPATRAGSPCGAVYFDTRNKYIPCLCVDARARRRGLGSLLVVAAVAVCESANATVAGDGYAQPTAPRSRDAAAGGSAGSDAAGGEGQGSEGGVGSVDDTGLSLAVDGCSLGAPEDVLLVRGARPNLCVSPKDLADSPHLHAFYSALGFDGGREDRGGNYKLSVDAGARLLASFQKRPELTVQDAGKITDCNPSF